MIYICFSAYNEEQNIENLLRRIELNLGRQGDYAVVAYNDGSTDGTLAELQRLKPDYPLTILHSPANTGLGGGMNRLVDHVCEHAKPEDIAVFMDGDDTHDPCVVAAMCNAIARGADVVVASRYCAGSEATGIPLYRQAISFGASLFWRLVLPIQGLRDYTCGFRAYRVEVLQAARVASGQPLIARRGFECQVELLHALRPYARFAEVPIRLAYDRKLGASKMRLLRTSWRTVSLGIHLMSRRGLGTKNG